jgi:DNA-binding NarL/FixJ family response regulator
MRPRSKGKPGIGDKKSQFALGQPIDGPISGSHRVLIVSEHRIFRECLSFWLRGANFSCDSVTCPKKGILKLSTQAPDLVLIDHSERTEATILRLVKAVCNHSSDIRLLVIGDRESERQLNRYLEAGAGGFVSKGQSLQVMLRAIKRVILRDAESLPEKASLVLAKLQQLSREREPAEFVNATDLTFREVEILKLIELGRSNKEIASELHLSIHTVKTHVHHILDKVGASNRRRAVYLAYRNGWLSKNA